MKLLENYRDNMEAFKGLHKTHLGSSRVAAICGLNKFCTPLQVWLEMRDLVELQSENEAMWFGTKLEPVVAEAYEKRTGKKLIRNNDIYGSEHMPWAMATPDYFDADDKLIEIKTHGAWAERLYGEQDLPDAAHTQVIWQMGILGCQESEVVALVGGQKLYTVPVSFSQPMFDQIVGVATAFMEMVKNGVPPEARASDKGLIDELYQLRKDQKELNAEHASLCEDWINLGKEKSLAKSALEAIEEKQKAVENQIRIALEGAEVGRCGRFEVAQKTIFRKEYTAKASSYTKFSLKEITENGEE